MLHWRSTEGYGYSLSRRLHCRRYKNRASSTSQSFPSKFSTVGRMPLVLQAEIRRSLSTRYCRQSRRMCPTSQSGKLWSNLPFLESLPFLEGFSIYGYASSKNGYADDVIVPKYRKCCAYVGTYRFPPNMRQMRLSPLVAFYSP